MNDETLLEEVGDNLLEENGNNAEAGTAANQNSLMAQLQKELEAARKQREEMEKKLKKQLANRSDLVNLALRADAECAVHCDGDFLFILEPGKIQKEQVQVGQHILEFVSTEDQDVKVEKVVDYPTADKNYVLIINEFSAIFELKKAKAAEEKAAKEAEAKRKEEEEAKLKAEEEAKRKAEEEAKRKAEEARYRKFTNVKDCSPNVKFDKTIRYRFQFYALDFEKIRIRRHLLLPDEEYRCELIFVSEEGIVHWYDCRRLHFNPFTLEFDNGETHIEPSPESNEEWIVFKNPFHVESEWDDDDVNVFLGGGIDGRPIDDRYFDWGPQDYDLISEKVPSELVCMPTILKFIRDNVEYIPVYKGF